MSEPNVAKKRLGDLLCQSGLITVEDLQRAIEEQKKTNKRMGEVLIDLKIVTEFDVANVLASQLGIQCISLEKTSIEPDAVSIVPEKLARKYLCIPIHIDKRQVSVAMVDPLDYECIRDIGFHSNFAVKPLIATRKEILKAIDQHYKLDDSIEDLVRVSDGLVHDAIEILPVTVQADVIQPDDLEKKSRMAPIIRLFNLIFIKAIKSRASDIHIDSQRNSLSVRFRVDGILRKELALPKWVHGALVSRIKVLALLDISERRLPQDGSIRVRLDNHDIDLRVSTIPAQHGEKVVVRILDQSDSPKGLESLGLADGDLSKLADLSKKRKGIFLVAGPTGSGKTSTLYALINRIRSEKLNVMTVEDPIEYQMEGVNQIQVKPEIGLTFANCLRSILRQDPNVILVGEIRDLETAEIAFRAAMTGHFVISTIHTNDAVSTLIRLLDMGIPRYILSTSLVGIVAQRLVRKICPECKVMISVLDEELGQRTLGNLPKKFEGYHGKGCSHCNATGFYGRSGIFEVFLMSSKIREMVASGATEEEIRLAAESQGMMTLGEDGLSKVKNGITTLEEVLRVIDVQEEIKILCPQCEKGIQPDYIVCPYCKHEMQSNCPSCKRRMQSDWVICPYCKRDR